jgi:hypothetical protein
MWNTAGREPAFVGSALSVPRVSLGPVPSRLDQPTETALELSVWSLRVVGSRAQRMRPNDRR